MEPYAVVETGGKQYRVQQGETLQVEKLDGDAGAKVKLDRVLAVSNGTQLSVGAPLVSGASVELEIVGQVRGPKLVSFKKKRRKGFKKTIGHRQHLTTVKVSAIAAG